ncbi:NADPH-dependent F420 reductase [Alterinioella nitratireducens]|jgi:predicted dinucleotide-binding enzyme|uniref:NADPH-dependent F420 reductase n=1 Tax=Alterinioella nitratireducens TaxID=2735915 RepID=UPI001557CD90|nr:NADPH-dependent F420 reductase [Alterinioella nitratireducens]NPD21699.1 NADPH-dependent F420 reductase [Alterinioella nitratireducens]
MRIAIIGNGNVGSGLAQVLGLAGHEVSVIGRNDDLSAAVSQAEVVVLATPYGAVADLAGKADFTGKTVIDVSNPVTEDFSGLQVGHKTSAAEEIASRLSGATVVKAFNTIFAQHYGTGLKLNGQPIQTFVAADDEAARGSVKALAAEIGLEPVDAGPLANARYLEPIGFLNIQFGYAFGHGTGIAPRWQFS